MDECYGYFGGMTWYVRLMMNEVLGADGAGNALKKLNVISDTRDKKKVINDLIFRDWLRNGL